jgi:hypothetical protein
VSSLRYSSSLEPVSPALELKPVSARTLLLLSLSSCPALAALLLGPSVAVAVAVAVATLPPSKAALLLVLVLVLESVEVVLILSIFAIAGTATVARIAVRSFSAITGPGADKGTASGIVSALNTGLGVSENSKKPTFPTLFNPRTNASDALEAYASITLLDL